MKITNQIVKDAVQEDTTTRLPNPHAKIARQEHTSISWQHSSAPIAYQECGVTATGPHFVKTVASDTTQNLNHHRRAIYVLITHLAQQSVPATPVTVKNVVPLKNVGMGSAKLDTRQKAPVVPVFLVNIMETPVEYVQAKRLPFFLMEFSSCLACTCSFVCYT
jgi:hypothetical protein